MVMRRQLLLGAVACGTSAPALTGCSVAADENAAARQLRVPFLAPAGERASDQSSAQFSPRAPASADMMRELVRYATLASGAAVHAG